MSFDVIPHTLDQQRLAANLAETYAPWMEAVRATHGDRWRWKKVKGEDYLYHLFHGSNNGRSLGPRSPHTEAICAQMQALEQRASNGEKRLLLMGRMYRAARLPILAPFAGAVLRELDAQGILGDQVMVVGTNALGAYEIEAGRSLDTGLHATEDFDLSWVGQTPAMETPVTLLPALQRADASWTVSMERTFQVVNRHGEVIDVLVAPSLLKGYPKDEKIRAIDVEGQEDLLGGERISQVVADLSGRPARIVAPDPRLYALHKWSLARDPTRTATKRQKDAQQALAVRQLVDEGMPALPFDKAFLKTLSPRLTHAWKHWQEEAKAKVTSNPSRTRLRR
jgi:hypothetical protein